MLRVKGDSTGSERKAAEKLAQIILRSWPRVSDDPTNHIWIIVGAKCYGQKIKDIDLLLLASFEAGLPYRPDHAFSRSSQRKLPDEVLVENLCAAIEVKRHYPEDIRFEGSRVQVYYQDSGWEDAAGQNHRQGIAVKGYIKDNGLKSPWVTNLLWLPNVPEKILPQCLHNILGSDLTWEHFLDVMILNDKNRILRQKSKAQAPVLASASSPDIVARVADLFTKTLVPTKLVGQQRQETDRKLSKSEPRKHVEKAIREENERLRKAEAELLRNRKVWGLHNTKAKGNEEEGNELRLASLLQRRGKAEQNALIRQEKHTLRSAPFPSSPPPPAGFQPYPAPYYYSYPLLPTAPVRPPQQGTSTVLIVLLVLLAILGLAALGMLCVFL